MEGDKDKLVNLFERKINLLLENNEGYARFKGRNLFKIIERILYKESSKKNIMDLGFLLHLYVLQFRLTMYKILTPFSMLNFRKDLHEIINVLHAYKRHRNPQDKLPPEFAETPEIGKLIPPLVEISIQKRSSPDNPKLYNEILNMLEENVGKVEVGIPKGIIKEMQSIDLKRIYNHIPNLIEREKNSTVRKLAGDFPVFENDRLALVAVFNEVLFLANEGKVYLTQMKEDIKVNLSLC